MGLSDFGSHVWGMDTVGFSVSRLGLVFTFVFGFKVVRAFFPRLKGDSASQNTQSEALGVCAQTSYSSS